MKLRVLVTPKTGVLDPEGRAIQSALADLGYTDVADLRTGKIIELDLAISDPAAARAILIRNMFKFLVLLIPVLAVVGLLNPHVQGLGDSIADTVVVRQVGGTSQRGPNDR